MTVDSANSQTISVAAQVFKLTPQQTEGMWLSLCDSDHDPAFVLVTYIVIGVLLVWIKIMSGYES